MATLLRVVHYVNQFFGGIGGEEQANVPVQVSRGPVGPGRALQQVLRDQGTVVATVICGDNYFSEEREKALAMIAEELKSLRPDVVVAGPAFEAGRYGLACGEVCRATQQLGIPALTGMHPENPGVASFGREIIVVPTGATTLDMMRALTVMAPLALRLGRREELGPAEVEGYLPRGIRRMGLREEQGFKRAVDMLVSKLGSQPFKTELPIRLPEHVAPAIPVRDLNKATIALVTTGGLVRKGNPDHVPASNAQRYYRHSVAELQSLSGTDWEAFHSGYFNHIVNSNPNYILPLSFMRELEADGIVDDVYPWIYALPGVSTPVAQARRLGEGVARDLKQDAVDGCILVAT